MPVAHQSCRARDFLSCTRPLPTRQHIGVQQRRASLCVDSNALPCTNDTGGVNWCHDAGPPGPHTPGTPFNQLTVCRECIWDTTVQADVANPNGTLRNVSLRKIRQFSLRRSPHNARSTVRPWVLHQRRTTALIERSIIAAFKWLLRPGQGQACALRSRCDRRESASPRVPAPAARQGWRGSVPTRCAIDATECRSPRRTP